MNIRPALVDKYDLIALETTQQLREALELDIDFAFAWAPEDLRDIAFERNATAEMLSNMLSAASVTADDKALYTYAGFVRPMTDAEWFSKMAAIAEGARRYLKVVDDNETLHADHMAEQIRIEAERAQARAVREAHTQAEAASEKARTAAPASVVVEAVTDDWEEFAQRDFELEEDERAEEGGDEHLSPEVDWVEHDIFLPAVRDGFMHLPNLIVGSGIVRTGPKNRTRERWTEQAPKVIRRVSGYKDGEVVISYSGEELRPGDIETWSKLLHAAVNKPLGSDVHIGARGLLTSLHGRGTGGNAYATLREEVTRLQAAMLHIKSSDPDFIDQMVDLFPSDPSVIKAKKSRFVEIRVQLLGASTTDGSTWTIEVPRKIRTLFGKKLSSWFDEDLYYSLKGDAARRLYLLYGSHVNCWPLRLAELKEYMGSTMGQDSKFRNLMNKAHDELKAKGAIKGWKFEQSHRRLETLCYVIDRKVKPKKKVEAKTVKCIGAAVV